MAIIALLLDIVSSLHKALTDVELLVPRCEDLSEVCGPLHEFVEQLLALVVSHTHTEEVLAVKIEQLFSEPLTEFEGSVQEVNLEQEVDDNPRLKILGHELDSVVVQLLVLVFYVLVPVALLADAAVDEVEHLLVDFALNLVLGHGALLDEGVLALVHPAENVVLLFCEGVAVVVLLFWLYQLHTVLLERMTGRLLLWREQLVAVAIALEPHVEDLMQPVHQPHELAFVCEVKFVDEDRAVLFRERAEKFVPGRANLLVVNLLAAFQTAHNRSEDLVNMALRWIVSVQDRILWTKNETRILRFDLVGLPRTSSALMNNNEAV